jgi:hypothetical protein
MRARAGEQTHCGNGCVTDEDLRVRLELWTERASACVPDSTLAR